MSPNLIIPMMALLAAAGAAKAQPAARDDVADALAGHRAEMTQLGEQADPLRRLLFFDPVEVESEPPGVPCDHLARRKPEAIAGRGVVVVLRADDGRLVRYWQPPEADATDPARIESKAREFAATRLESRGFAIVALRAFGWCR